MLLFLAFLTIHAVFSQKLPTNFLFHLHGEGFHRMLTVSLESVSTECALLLKWEVPETYYVDPYQIHDLIEGNLARLVAPVNTEQMAHQATPNALYTVLKEASNYSQAIPIHLRYNLPSSNEYTSTSTLKPPSMFYSCSCGTKCSLDETDKASEWVPIGEPLAVCNELATPVGNLQHSSFVTIVTLAFSFTSTVYIALVR